MDGGAWWAAVHGVAKSQTRLSDFTFTFHFHALEKEMATHSSVLAWRIPGTGEPGGLTSMGSHRVRHDWSDLAAAAHIFLGFCSLILFLCVHTFFFSSSSQTDPYFTVWFSGSGSYLEMSSPLQDWWRILSCLFLVFSWLYFSYLNLWLSSNLFAMRYEVGNLP